MKSRAMVQTGDRKLELRELDVPPRPAAGEALLKVEACGMCGTDVDQFEGGIKAMGMVEYPSIPGHEVVGRIAQIDDMARDRWGIDVGQRVAVHAIMPCGNCRNCRAGKGCPSVFYYGFRSADIGSGLWGGFADYMQITANTQLYTMPDTISVEDACLVFPMAAGFDWAVRAGGTTVGDTILIFGPGQRGLAAVIAANEAGAEQIIVTGLARDARKLALTREYGATATIEADREDVVAAVRELTDGRGADRLLDVTPITTKPLADAIEAARPGATIVLAGNKGGQNMPDFPVDRVITKRLKITSVMSTSNWAVERAIATIGSGKYALDRMNTHTMPFTELERAVHILNGDVSGENAIHMTLVP